VNGERPPEPAVPRLGEARLWELLEAFAARRPAPGAGAAVGLATALGAALAAMAARFAAPRHLVEGEDLALAAEDLAREALRLGDEDADAYAEVLRAGSRARARDPVAGGLAPARPATDAVAGDVAAALSRAAAIPLALADVAARVAELAARLAREGNPNLVGECTTAAALAEASARAASSLVAMDLAHLSGDPRLAEARTACERAAAALASLGGRDDPTTARAAVARGARPEPGRAASSVVRAGGGGGGGDTDTRRDHER